MGSQASTRILGRRTAPFPPFLIFLTASRVVLPKILVLIICDLAQVLALRFAAAQGGGGEPAAAEGELGWAAAAELQMLGGGRARDEGAMARIFTRLVPK